MNLLVLSQQDPVARGVSSLLGTGEATDWKVQGTPVRRLSNETYTLKREPLHVTDEGLDALLPVPLMKKVNALIFPSVHRSQSNLAALTVHPLGNLTADNQVGGMPNTVNPVPPHLMTEAFLRLSEEGARVGMEVTFEATHHGPSLSYPSFFVEVGSTVLEWERRELQRAVANVVTDLLPSRTSGSQVVVGVGGGHYMPFFKDLVRRRRVSVAHLVPSHDLASLSLSVAEQVVRLSPGAQGCVWARARDREACPIRSLLADAREADLPPRK